MYGSIPTRPKCPLVKLPDVRKDLIAPASVILWLPRGKFVSAVHTEVQSLRSFLHVGRSGLWGNQKFNISHLVENNNALLTVFQFNISLVFWSFNHYLKWCSSVCRWEQCNLIKFNNLRQPNVKKVWWLNAFLKVLMYCILILAMPEFNLFFNILSTWRDLLFSPDFISKGTTVSYAVFLFILEMSNEVTF